MRHSGRGTLPVDAFNTRSMVFSFYAYPGFQIAASDILFFVRVRDTFVLWVFHGTIVYFCPDDPDNFLSWLSLHHIHQLPDAVPAG